MLGRMASNRLQLTEEVLGRSTVTYLHITPSSTLCYSRTTKLPMQHGSLNVLRTTPHSTEFRQCSVLDTRTVVGLAPNPNPRAPALVCSPPDCRSTALQHIPAEMRQLQNMQVSLSVLVGIWASFAAPQKHHPSCSVGQCRAATRNGLRL